MVHFGFCTASSLIWRWGGGGCCSILFSVQQRGRGPLREDTKYGCVADYRCPGPQELVPLVRVPKLPTIHYHPAT